MTRTTLSPEAGTLPPGFAAAWRQLAGEHARALRAAGIVGGGLALVRGETILAATHYGLADRATRRPTDLHTIYHWASVTKTFTGMAVMQLRDRGRLHLDDPVVRYLPELRAVHDPFGSLETVTLRHLMTHSAGFRGPTWPWGGDQPWHPHEPATWSQLVAMFPYTTLHFAPGTKTSYSNLGIVFLGRIIEILTGDDYEVYIDKNLLRPLGMYASYFDHTPYHLLPHRSNNYEYIDGTLRENGLDFDTGITVSNGGLNASLADMARYVGFLLGATARQDVYEGVLRRSSLEEMWRPHYEHGRFGPYRESVGLTFFLMEKEGMRVIGHTGDQKGFRALLYVDPARQVGVLGTFNTETPRTKAVLFALREALFDRILPLFEPG
ncbi:beta-lactamase family protein [Rhodocaloribacter litoris]|uniref:serine hydrolase domain-containing protein n=1 Tax=Rhodocaloribacter litoris TaxID=2558931 RepID=UPI00141E9A8A|nr:serine hydrolase domain-containing protein [Rhodocaloribacter litoris]QXD16493.1 beta-lactamase family protein [Rhodocaloribacter litoris]